jgi:hypothetical protein
MNEFISPGVFQTLVAAFGLVMLYVAIYYLLRWR